MIRNLNYVVLLHDTGKELWLVGAGLPILAWLAALAVSTVENLKLRRRDRAWREIQRRR